MPPTPPDPSIPLYRVGSQYEGTRADASGRFVEGVIVPFTTRGGHTGTIFVPKGRYVPAAVRDLLARAATELDQVGQLEG